MSWVKPTRGPCLVIDIEDFSLGCEGFFPAVGQGSVKVGPTVLIRRHAMVGRHVRSGGRGARGKLRHHGLLRVHGEMHGSGDLVRLVWMACCSVHHLAGIFPGRCTSVVAAERERAETEGASLLTCPF